jgi:hypothetical protein
MVWHQRLVHPSFSIFQNLLKNQQLPLTGSVDKTKICSSCQLGKSKQQPFFESTRVSTGPLELIHSDVWTSPISSLSGCKFYVLFIDDYFRFTWLYPILNKSDVYQCFVKFKLLAEKIFSTKIKQFQFDNGGEYVSNQFKHFLTRNGILYKLTCPHTSQQNGIAKREHRHVMEMGLTLLAQVGLSPKYCTGLIPPNVHLSNQQTTHSCAEKSITFLKTIQKIP